MQNPRMTGAELSELGAELGLDVTGAFLGSALSLTAVGLVLTRPLSHHLKGVQPGPEDDMRLRMEQFTKSQQPSEPQPA